MQSRKFFGAGRVNVSKEQHVFEPTLAPPFVAASAFKCFWILERAKEHVPQRDVREVVSVMTKLMMNPMGFRPLENEADPRRCCDVPMIEKLPAGDQNGVVRSGTHGGAEQRIHNQTAQDRINQDLHWMFVKAGNDFQSTSGMMNLM